MTKQKFTVFLIPDTEGYQVVIPHFPEAITFGQTPREAFANAREALELALEDERDPIPPNVHAAHTIVGEVEVDIPEHMLEEVRLYSMAKQPSQIG